MREDDHQQLQKPPESSESSRDEYDNLHAPSIEEQLKSAMPHVTATIRVRIARTIAQLREEAILLKQQEGEVCV